MTTASTSAVVVTGGGSGIGRATCLALAEAGRAVAVWDLNAASPSSTTAAINLVSNSGSIAVAVDVRDAAAVRAAAAQTIESLGQVGAIAQCAGIGGLTPIDEIDEQTWDDILGVNLKAQMIIVQAFLDSLRAIGRGASVVCVSSIEGLVGNQYLPAYCASKAGVIGLTRSLADALGPAGIRVNAVCPGAVRTPMLQPLLDYPELREMVEHRIPLQHRIAEPEEIAAVIRFLLSEEASYVHGAAVVVDGGAIAARE